MGDPPHASDAADGEDAVALRAARHPERLEEWFLVLASQGIAAQVRRVDAEFALEVAEADAERAREAIDRYERENPPAEVPARPGLAAAGTAAGDASPGVWAALGLLAFFAVTGPRRAAVRWFDAGSADAARILDGELWRTVTALTLHADLLHAASNALFGAIFFAAACHLLGSGLALLLVLLAGAGGNLVNASFHGTAHVSVGASTAVFGAVGLLGGAGVVRRRRGGARGRRAWTPVAAGLGILAMLGASERTDLWAHLFGLGAGGVLGLACAVRLEAPPRRGVQALLGALAALALLYCWAVALDATPS